MALLQSVRPPATIAGFPLSAWAFALRIWAAMMVALYAAFWLQLESASSAAVTVGVLALQTRGQAYRCPQAVYEHLPKRWRGRTERAALHKGKAVRQFLHRHGQGLPQVGSAGQGQPARIHRIV
jgi:hypothetical protein